MANTIRVIYGTEIDTTVDGSMTPDTILNTLKVTYKELSDANYTMTPDGDGGQVMRITLKEGRKAV